MRIYLYLFLFFSPLYCSAQFLTPIHSDLEGDALLDALVDDFKTSVVLPSGEARDLMYSDIHNIAGSVFGVYTGHGIFLPSGVDPSTFVFMNGSNDGINAEHVWPRSKGAEIGIANTDLHNLFPTRVLVNTNRGSFPFAEIDDNETELWYFEDDEMSNIPNSNRDNYSEGVRGVNGRFEPRESRKGDIARTMFYFYTMYQPQADAADPDFFDDQLSTLCAWHEQDPVDEEEYNRTFKIAEVQDGKPNPFILDCSLVSRAYCQTEDLECPVIPTVSTSNLPASIPYKFFPNPIDNTMYVEAMGLSQLLILDVQGRLLIREDFDTRTTVNTSSLVPGTYILIINEATFKLVK